MISNNFFQSRIDPRDKTSQFEWCPSGLQSDYNSHELIHIINIHYAKFINNELNKVNNFRML